MTDAGKNDAVASYKENQKRLETIPEHQMIRRESNRVSFALRWSMALLCVGFVVHFFVSNWEGIAPLFEIRPWWLAAIAGLMIGELITCSIRHNIALHKCNGVHVPPWAWFRVFVLARFANMIGPQLGNVYRGVRLKREWSVCYTGYISSYVAFAWIDMLMGILLALAVVLVVRPGLLLGAVEARYVLLAAAAIVAAAPFVLQALLSAGPRGAGRLGWLHEKVATVLRETAVSALDKTYLAKMLLLGTLSFAIRVLAIYAGFAFLNLTLGASETVLFAALLRIGSLVQITPGNIGVRELVWGAMGALLEAGAAPAMLAAATLRLLAVVLVIVLAAVFGVYELLFESRTAESEVGKVHHENPQVGTDPA